MEQASHKGKDGGASPSCGTKWKSGRAWLMAPGPNPGIPFWGIVSSNLTSSSMLLKHISIFGCPGTPHYFGKAQKELAEWALFHTFQPFLFLVLA